MESQKVAVRFSTDVLAKNLLLHVLGDYRTFYGDSAELKSVESTFLTDIASFRSLKLKEMGLVEPHRFKMRVQLENLLKKYKFAQDAFSSADLEKRTLEKYFEEQIRITTFQERSITTQMVLGRARKLARSILGKFDVEEVVKECKFGRKSSIGCPLNLAYIDIKLSDAAAFTSSSGCSKIFSNILAGDPILSEIVSKIEIKKENLEHNTLKLIPVPKSWKIGRLVAPLTLLSLFYSNGIGGYVTKLLNEANLRISNLQARHRSLVQKFSVDCSHATADLSSASDSITVELLCSILPRDWFVALKPLFCHTVLHKDGDNVVSSYTASVLPMGSGATFPLETLIFYCLIKAIGTLTETHGTYSVYGDDLIYPSRVHKYVCRVFSNLGLTMNLDKTFVKYPFRESCGADFYRGADVRSFYFEGESAELSRSKYRALLHKTYNGLAARWDIAELPTTFAWLLSELGNFGSIMRVPPRYPDESGIKVPCHSSIPLAVTGVDYTPITVLCDRYGNHTFKFTCMEYVTERRVVAIVMPYYWLALQGLTDDVSERYLSPDPFSLQSSLAWTLQKHERYYVDQKGKRRKKIVKVRTPTVDSRTGGRHRVSNESTGEWI